jgi:hypothetical protein
MAEQATDCDWCHAAIVYGERAWMIQTGEVFDGLPVAKFECDRCHFGDGSATSGAAATGPLEGPPSRIQRKRTAGWRMPTNARYVGRPGVYGNPYKVGDVYLVGPLLPFPLPTARTWEGPAGSDDLRAVKCPDADTAVAWFRAWASLALEPCTVELLRGMHLACWCPLDQPCHADVLLEMANATALTGG